MMIHLIDQDTKETFKSFNDNEVQAAIAAARASGKIVNMELDQNNEHCLIYIMRPKKDFITELYDESHKVTVFITKTAKTITETLKEITPILTEAAQQMAATIQPIVEFTIGELAPLAAKRPPSEIKKEIKHTKNPMQLSKLYKELNESYKAYGRKHNPKNYERR